MHLKFKVSKSKSLNGIRCLEVTEPIKKDEVIESCPALVLSEKDSEALDNTVMGQYYFYWDGKVGAVGFGYGALINHSDEPNVDLTSDEENEALVFKALRDIDVGEELFLDYFDGDNEHLRDYYLDYGH